MAITQNWNIKSRSHQCASTGSPFEDGQAIVAAIFPDAEDPERFERKDYSVDAWESRPESEPTPFSSWHTNYEAPVKEEKPEVVEKESAEALLRRLIEEDESHTENARFILAIMLERKKQLKEIEVNNTPTSRLLIYEHEKSGEVFIVKDPQLKLDEVDIVQQEVSELLGGGKKDSASGEDSPEPAGEETQSEASGDDAPDSADPDATETEASETESHEPGAAGADTEEPESESESESESADLEKGAGDEEE